MAPLVFTKTIKSSGGDYSTFSAAELGTDLDMEAKNVDGTPSTAVVTAVAEAGSNLSKFTRSGTGSTSWVTLGFEANMQAKSEGFTGTTNGEFLVSSAGTTDLVVHDAGGLIADHAGADGQKVTLDITFVIEMYDNGTSWDPGALTIATTANPSSAKHRKWTAPPGDWYNPATDTGLHISRTVNPITLDEAWVEFWHARITTTDSSNSFNVQASSGADNGILDSCFIDRAVGTGATQRLLLSSAGTDSFQVRNCIFEGSNSDTAGPRFGIIITVTPTNMFVYNCIFYHFKQGAAVAIDAAANTTLTVKNCYLFENDTHLNMHASATHDYNALDTANSETNGVANADPDDVLVDWTTGNFKPVGGAALDGEGLDLSGTFTLDFTGATRATPWEIGPYSVVSHAVVMSSNCESELLADLDVIVEAAFSPDGESVLAAKLSLSLLPQSDMDSESSMSAGLTIIVPFAASSSAESELDADLSIIVPLGCHIDAESQLTANLPSSNEYASTIVAESDLTANLLRTLLPTSSMACESELDANLVIVCPCAMSTAGLSECLADLDVLRVLAFSSEGESVLSASAEILLALGCAPSGDSELSAELLMSYLVAFVSAGSSSLVCNLAVSSGVAGVVYDSFEMDMAEFEYTASASSFHETIPGQFVIPVGFTKNDKIRIARVPPGLQLTGLVVDYDALGVGGSGVMRVGTPTQPECFMAGLDILAAGVGVMSRMQSSGRATRAAGIDIVLSFTGSFTPVAGGKIRIVGEGVRMPTWQEKARV